MKQLMRKPKLERKEETLLMGTKKDREVGNFDERIRVQERERVKK